MLCLLYPARKTESLCLWHLYNEHCSDWLASPFQFISNVSAKVIFLSSPRYCHTHTLIGAPSHQLPCHPYYHSNPPSRLCAFHPAHSPCTALSSLSLSLNLLSVCITLKFLFFCHQSWSNLIYHFKIQATNSSREGDNLCTLGKSMSFEWVWEVLLTRINVSVESHWVSPLKIHIFCYVYTC